ncbi:MAG: glycosyltransferase [Acidobacteria bacterium]|nr:glycosyltransferase [Acidobacteriota bacterium]
MTGRSARVADPGLSSGTGPAILWASPLPPTRSGVADYAAELLPFLSAHAPVTLVTPPDWRSAGEEVWATGIPRVGCTQPPDGEAVSLLHLGNNPYHEWVATRLRRFGGTVVLHDSVLHHLLVEEAASEDAWDRFDAELTDAEGAAGGAIAAARRSGFHGRLDPFLFPALRVYLRLANAVVVHSHDAASRVRRASPGTPVEQVPLAVSALPGGQRAEARRYLGLPEREVVLAHLGFLTPAKGLQTILVAVLALAELGVPIKLLVVGEGREGRLLEEEARHAGVADRVRLTGWAEPDALGRILAAADLGLVPRYPTAGETSAAALRFLAVGTPVVVSGYRQFLELPPSAAFRIAPGRAGAAELVRIVAHVARNPESLSGARVAARRAWEGGGHPPADAARRLLEAIERLAGARSPRAAGGRPVESGRG